MLAVAGLFGRTTCGIAIYDKEFGFSRVSAGAVRELSRKGEGLENALAARILASFTCCLTGLQSLGCLVHDALCSRRIFLKILGQTLRDGLLNQRADLGVAKLRLGLTLELRIMQFDGDNGS